MTVPLEHTSFLATAIKLVSIMSMLNLILKSMFSKTPTSNTSHRNISLATTDGDITPEVEKQRSGDGGLKSNAPLILLSFFALLLSRKAQLLKLENPFFLRLPRKLFTETLSPHSIHSRLLNQEKCLCFDFHSVHNKTITSTMCYLPEMPEDRRPERTYETTDVFLLCSPSGAELIVIADVSDVYQLLKSVMV